MGSGGGGSYSGSSPSGLPKGKAGKPKGGSGGGGGSGIPDHCTFQFEADLSAVDPSVTEQLEIGDFLSVALIKRQGFDVVICRSLIGGIAGTIANVAELSELIVCMSAGANYVAEVRDVSSSHCTVFVEREP